MESIIFLNFSATYVLLLLTISISLLVLFFVGIKETGFLRVCFYLAIRTSSFYTSQTIFSSFVSGVENALRFDYSLARIEETHI